MTTYISNVFSINGVVDTNQTVLQNMNTLASAAGAWVTYDINAGKWAVIINQAGTSISSFTDSNIIGSVSVSSTGLTELYNSVEIEFPNSDNLDQKDYIKFEIPSGDRFPNEPDNELQIQMDIINNSVQAELIASRELKQSRVDKIIEFRTDYTKLGLKAGDLIDVTLSQYGWTSKVFRIMKIVEEDGDDGIFSLSISALEYNSDVYSTTGLTRTARSVSPEITAKKNNAAVASADTGKTTDDLTNSLTDPNNLALAIALMSALAPNSSSGRGSTGLTPRVYNFQTGFIFFTEFIYFNNSDTVFATTAYNPAEFYNLGVSTTLPFDGYYQIDYYINSTTGLTRTARSISPEITAKKNNAAVASADTGKTTDDLTNSLTDPNNLALAIALMSALAPNSSSGRGSTGLTPRVYNFQTGFIFFTEFIYFNNSDTVFATTAYNPAEFYNLGVSTTLPFDGYYQIDYYINCGASNYSTLPSGNYLVPMTIRKRGGIAVSINGSFPTVLSYTTVLKGEDIFADITNSSVDYYAAGTTLQFYVYYRHDLENNNLVEYPKGSGSYYAINSFAGYSTPVHFGLITGNVSFVGS